MNLWRNLVSEPTGELSQCGTGVGYIESKCSCNPASRLDANFARKAQGSRNKFLDRSRQTVFTHINVYDAGYRNIGRLQPLRSLEQLNPSGAVQFINVHSGPSSANISSGPTRDRNGKLEHLQQPVNI